MIKLDWLPFTDFSSLYFGIYKKNDHRVSLPSSNCEMGRVCSDKVGRLEVKLVVLIDGKQWTLN